jgi:hypothetical protein
VDGIITFLSTNYFKESEYIIGKSLTAADLAAYF